MLLMKRLVGHPGRISLSEPMLHFVLELFFLRQWLISSLAIEPGCISDGYDCVRTGIIAMIMIIIVQMCTHKVP